MISCLHTHTNTVAPRARPVRPSLPIASVQNMLPPVVPIADAPAPRVAVAMAGQLRSVMAVMHNFQAHVLKPLAAELFMDVSPQDTNHRGNLPGYGMKNITNQQLDVINATLKPLHLLVDYGSGRLNDAATYYGLFLRWSRLLTVIRKRERHLALAYDWIIRVRPDLMYRCAITTRVLQDSAGHSVLDWDSVAILPRRAADIAMQLPSRARLRCICSHKVDYCVDEYLLMKKEPFLKAESRPIAAIYRPSWAERRPAAMQSYLECGVSCRDGGASGDRAPWLAPCNITRAFHSGRDLAAVLGRNDRDGSAARCLERRQAQPTEAGQRRSASTAAHEATSYVLQLGRTACAIARAGVSHALARMGALARGGA